MLVLCLEINIYKFNLSILYVAISQDYSPSFKILGVVYRIIKSWKRYILCEHPFRTWDYQFSPWLSMHLHLTSFVISLYITDLALVVLSGNFRRNPLHGNSLFSTHYWVKCVAFFQFLKLYCNPVLLIVIQYYGQSKYCQSKWLKTKWGQNEEMLQITDQLRYLHTKEKTTR